jgi:hypothetical protein
MPLFDAIRKRSIFLSLSEQFQKRKRRKLR